MSPSMIDTTTTVTMTTNVIVRSSPQLGQMTMRSSSTMSSKLRMMPRRGAGAGRCITLFDLGSVGTVLAMVLIPESGRGGATRTPDPRFWRPLLYQLSYTPVPVGANSIRRLPPYLVSLWAVCFRHRGQNFWISSRSGSFFLFLTVVELRFLQV